MSNIMQNDITLKMRGDLGAMTLTGNHGDKRALDYD